jgi:RNA polymerase sigma-70 factor (ECF subfamily)
MSDPRQTLPGDLANARERFFALLADLRAELHRYCARLTGSVIDGEDIVQDSLAKAFYAASMVTELPPLRPWLFRIAHDTGLDFLKSHARKHRDPGAESDDLLVIDDRPDPAVVRAAISRFVALPVAQRSAVILKDVLGQSPEEAAATMGATVPAVRTALVRGRARLRRELDGPGDAPEPTASLAAAPRPTANAEERAFLDAYAGLFNARDWDGLRSMIGEDCRLDLVSKSHRRGKEVGAYFARYEQEQDQRIEVVRLEGRDVLGVFTGARTRPDYFVLLTWGGGRVSAIRDYRYTRHIALEAEL